MDSRLQFAGSVSTLHDLDNALDEICAEAAGRVVPPVDLAVLFISADRAGHAERIAAEVRRRTGARVLAGCTGESIVGTGQEIERTTALSLWTARMEGAAITPLRLHMERSPEGPVIVGWPDELADVWPEGSLLIVLGDPFSFPADVLASRLSDDQPAVRIVGGMASGATRPGGGRLLLNDDVFDDGAVALLISGPLAIRTVVSQGCRPIGRPLVITRAEENVIFELGGEPALVRLKEMFETLPDRDKRMVQQGLHLGRVVNEYQDRFEQGDFLIRNVLRVDPDLGAIQAGDSFRIGQTVQFQVRDHETADAELRHLLAQLRDAAGPPPAAGLLFTCNGRGTRLFPEPHHDAGAVRDVLGEIPLAGFFAAGEIGPVGGRNFVHGFTASLAIFS